MSLHFRARIHHPRYPLQVPSQPHIFNAGQNRYIILPKGWDQ